MALSQQELITIFENELAAWDDLLLDLSPERITERWLRENADLPSGERTGPGKE